MMNKKMYVNTNVTSNFVTFSNIFRSKISYDSSTLMEIIFS
ncbi:hypothetical protein [Clostridium sp.]